MGKQILVVGPVIAVVLTMASVALTDVPQLISFQGKLYDPAGNPLTGRYEITFRIYDREEGGVPLWSETDSVQCDGGLYQVILGLKSPLVLDFNGNFWLGIQVTGDPEELSPRYRLVSVPYAFRAAVAESVVGGGGGPDDDWTGAGTGSMYPTHLTDKVGIGTTSPTAKLHVNAGGTGNALQAEGGASYSIRALWDGSSLGAAILAKNTGTGGDALQVFADGTGRSGIYARGSSGVDYAIRADANGATWASYLSGKAYVSDRIGIGATDPKNKLDVEGAMVVGSAYSGSSTAPTNGMLVQGNVGIGATNPGSHRFYVESAGSGVGGATAYIKNTHTNGLAMVVEATSDDLPLLVSQKGDGDIFRCDSWTGGWHPVFKVENDGKTTCSVLQITGGSDIAEPFDIVEPDAIEPGMVVVIDPENPEKLKIADRAYDRCVAGIVSGAGGIKPGIAMVQEDTFEGDHQVALTGRVYGLCDASYGSIEPGDLLTTSPTPGYAMKATDYERAQGAILGKAMTNLDEGQGLVLILVCLQ
ncbi:MAG: hypothetical protein ACE5OR_03755 [bacterium]